MVSRRNYLSMTMIIGVVFFLFVGSELLRQYYNLYTTNSFIRTSELDASTKWQQDSDLDPAEMASGTFCAYIGPESEATCSSAQIWAEYAKRYFFRFDSVDAYTASKVHNPECLFIDGAHVDVDDAAVIRDLAESGTDIIFMKLPSPEKIGNSQEWRELLGIRFIDAYSVPITGYHLYSGFLLGGESYYRVEKAEDEKKQDLELTVPWYVPLSGTKTYMNGLLEPDQMTPIEKYTFNSTDWRNEFMPAIIWRRAFDTSSLFCVSVDFMEDQQIAIGLIDAMFYEMNPYVVYPVVNAQNLSVLNCPVAADENTEEMQKVYSRTQTDVTSDIIIPELYAINNESDWKMTAFFTPQMDYADYNEPNVALWDEYLKAFGEFNSELGLSLLHWDATELKDKLSRDEEFYREADNGYQLGAALFDQKDEAVVTSLSEEALVKNVNTLTAEYNTKYPILGYSEDRITVQQMTADAINITYSDDLRVKATETALGYTNVMMDFTCVYWPEQERDHWQHVIKETTANLKTTWNAFSKFTRTTLSESDERVRSFLASSCESKEEDNVITIIQNTENITGRYMLRLHGKHVVSVSDGEYTALEKGAYLIESESAEIKVYLASDIQISVVDDHHEGESEE